MTNIKNKPFNIFARGTGTTTTPFHFIDYASNINTGSVNSATSIAIDQQRMMRDLLSAMNSSKVFYSNPDYLSETENIMNILHEPFELMPEEVNTFISRLASFSKYKKEYDLLFSEDYHDMFSDAVEAIKAPWPTDVLYAISEDILVGISMKCGYIGVFINDRCFVLENTGGAIYDLMIVGTNSVKLDSEQVISELIEFLEDYCGFQYE